MEAKATHVGQSTVKKLVKSGLLGKPKDSRLFCLLGGVVERSGVVDRQSALTVSRIFFEPAVHLKRIKSQGSFLGLCNDMLIECRAFVACLKRWCHFERLGDRFCQRFQSRSLVVGVDEPE